MGEVYKAFDPSLDRSVALKTITAGADNPMLLDRLMREARACGRLRHPAIVMVHDLGEADGVVFIAMEYLEGRNLADTLTAGPLTLAHKFQILIEILHALDYAHREGVVHRDIKPSNVHMLADGHIKLLDFGLARIAQAEALTLTGEVMGTPHYMSPEQMKGQPIDGRTDIYSTGVMGYELFTQRRAFDGESITAIMLKVLGEPAPPMATPLSAALPEIEAIITRAMSKSPKDRFQNAGEMADALQSVLDAKGDALAQIDRDSGVAGVWSPEAGARTTRARPGSAPIAQRPSEPDMDPTLAAPHATTPAAAARLDSSDDPRLKVAESTGASAQSRADRSERSGWMWVAIAAAVLIVGLGAFVLARMWSTATSDTTRAAVQAPAGESAAGSRVQGAPAVTDAARTAETRLPAGSAPPTSPPAAATRSAATAASSVAAPPPSSDRAGAPGRDTPDRTGGDDGAGRRGLRALAAAARRAVYISGPNSPLTSAVATALGPRGIERRLVADNARWDVSVHTDVSVRNMPIGGTSLLTADYSGELIIRDRVSGRTETRSFDGHVADAGEAVVRRKAVRELAERIADEIAAIIK